MTSKTSSNFMVTSLVRTDIPKPKEHVTTNTLHKIYIRCLPKKMNFIKKRIFIFDLHTLLPYLTYMALNFYVFSLKKTFLFYDEIKQRHSRNLYEKKIRQHAKKSGSRFEKFLFLFPLPSFSHAQTHKWIYYTVFYKNSLLIYFKMWFIIAWTEKKALKKFKWTCMCE